MKKILFSLAALAALSMVAVGCKKPTDSAKEQQKTLDPPKTYAVTIINGTGVQKGDYSVEPAKLTDLSGTQTIIITPAANLASGKTLTVKKDGSPVTAESDGKFNVQVSGATTITVDVVITPPVDNIPPTAGTVTVDTGTDKNKVITVEFSEKVKAPQQAKCVITTNCTATVAIASVAMDDTDASGKKVKITLDKAMDSNVTVTLNKGFVKDLAGNESEEKTGVVFTKVN